MKQSENLRNQDKVLSHQVAWFKASNLCLQNIVSKVRQIEKALLTIRVIWILFFILISLFIMLIIQLFSMQVCTYIYNWWTLLKCFAKWLYAYSQSSTKHQRIPQFGHLPSFIPATRAGFSWPHPHSLSRSCRGISTRWTMAIWYCVFVTLLFEKVQLMKGQRVAVHCGLAHLETLLSFVCGGLAVPQIQFVARSIGLWEECLRQRCIFSV